VVETGAGLIGLGGAKASVEGSGALPVTAGLERIARREAGVAKTLAGAGLLILVASLSGQGERGGVLGMRVIGPARGEQRLAEPVERLSLTDSVSVLTEQGQGLLLMANGLPITGAQALPVWSPL
jgi:hypothetical protein